MLIIKEEEIKALEKYFNINLSDAVIYTKSGEDLIKKQTDVSIKDKISQFHIRVQELQKKAGLSDADFSQMLGLFPDEYKELKSGSLQPDLRMLNALKRSFNISIDMLLYGAD